MNKTIKGIGHVFYPESCPIENVTNFILDRYNCCISPVHNRDINKNGVLKKPHYHILFQGNLSEKDKRYISSITTMNYFEQLFDLPESFLYLYHWSSKTNWYIKGKAQYWSGDIVYSERWTEIVFQAAKEDIFIRSVQFCSSFVEWSDLLDCLCISDDSEMRDYIIKHTMMFSQYVKSNKYRFPINKKLNNINFSIDIE